MITDKQKICKCGADVAEFLGDTRTLEIYVRATNAGNSAINVSAFQKYADTMYRDINKIDDDCGTDNNTIRWANAGIFNRLDELGHIKDSKQFEEKKKYIIRDLDKITYDVVQKVKECSK